MRKYVIAGLLVWLPLGATVLVVKFLVELMDQTLLFLPTAWRPDALLGFHVPGLGLVLTLLVLFVTGILVANLLGRRLVAIWESLLARIPIVRPLYAGVKQIAETVFAPSSQSFRKVLLVEFPRRGLWSLCFQTSSDLGEVQEKTGEEVIAVFLPTTPNPTSGYIVLVPKKDVIELAMTVDEGLKMIISLGVVVPPWPRVPGLQRVVANPEG